jgi:hypothetical protein
MVCHGPCYAQQLCNQVAAVNGILAAVHRALAMSLQRVHNFVSGGVIPVLWHLCHVIGKPSGGSSSYQLGHCETSCRLYSA